MDLRACTASFFVTAPLPPSHRVRFDVRIASNNLATEVGQPGVCMRMCLKSQLAP